MKRAKLKNLGELATNRRVLVDRVRAPETSPSLETQRRAYVLARFGLVIAALAFPLVGCERGDSEAVVIATNLPAAERRALIAALPSGAGVKVRWITMADGIAPARMLVARARVDLALGGPLDSYGSITSPGALYAYKGSELGLAVQPRAFQERALPPPSAEDSLDSPLFNGLVGLGDPRIDPAAFGFASNRLRNAANWADGYAALVRLASHSAPIGRGRDAPRAQLARGDVAVIPAARSATATITDGITFQPLEGQSIEGLAVVSGSRHSAAAQRLLKVLATEGRISPVEPARIREDGLLADLLGATLVEARNELVQAREALAAMPENERRAKLARDLAEPPPWPPASVRKLGEFELVEALAAQIAPELDSRYWLLQSWEAPPQPIDGAMLTSLAHAVGGKLAASTRFRAWLNAEWIAWTRQRYRRVAREALRAAGT